MKINIAICDDEIPFCDHLQTLLRRFEQNHPGILLSINQLYSGETIYQRLMQSCYDLIFMDIEFPNGQNGIDIVKKLRKEKKYSAAEFIFISNHNQYALNLFPLFPLTYIQKGSNLESQLNSAMEQYLRLSSKRYNAFIPIKGTTFSAEQISHIECRGHLIYPNGIENHEPVRLRTSFHEYCEELKKYGFIQISQSVCVNTSFLAQYNKNELILKNNLTFKVTAKYRSQLQDYLSNIPCNRQDDSYIKGV